MVLYHNNVCIGIKILNIFIFRLFVYYEIYINILIN
jgi:hypothetical protein